MRRMETTERQNAQETAAMALIHADNALARAQEEYRKAMVDELRIRDGKLPLWAERDTNLRAKGKALERAALAREEAYAEGLYVA